ncbi:hypothetical protein KIW84_043636 [Lathyrus oleraceus]|uniref:Uncharacterized protein n=1 Tax=Pisum sativum TaxID=3888 RepID=A0A9D4XFZ7_PEA|nr:hypothetical protein KIW84_043636 [Pisum sativum]
MTPLCPPPEKLKTKGGVKKKGKEPAEYDVYRDPSYHESYIEDVVNVESYGNYGFRVITSLHGYGEDGWPMVRRELRLEIIDKDRSTLYDKLFSNRLPEVRESLMIESFGSQPPEKWLTLPDMGYLIANCTCLFRQSMHDFLSDDKFTFTKCLYLLHWFC